MEAVETETENTTVVAATDIAAVEAGTVIVTETEIGNTVAMITNAGAVTKIETKTVAVETVTARGTKGTTGNGEGRGKKTRRTPLMQREKELMTDPTFRPVLVLET